MVLSFKQAATILEGILEVITDNPPQPPVQCMTKQQNVRHQPGGELRTKQIVIFLDAFLVEYSVQLLILHLIKDIVRKHTKKSKWFITWISCHVDGDSSMWRGESWQKYNVEKNSDGVSVQGPCGLACGLCSMQDFQITVFSLFWGLFILSWVFLVPSWW